MFDTHSRDGKISNYDRLNSSHFYNGNIYIWYDHSRIDKTDKYNDRDEKSFWKP